MRAISVLALVAAIGATGCFETDNQPTGHVYGVKPNAGLEFAGTEWGYGVTADGTGGWVLSMLGDPTGNFSDRFTGTVYTTVGTIGQLATCETCQAAGVTAASSTQADFDVIVSGTGQAGFSFVRTGGASTDPVVFDLTVNGFHSGSWAIYFVNTDTNQVSTAPENPIQLVSP